METLMKQIRVKLTGAEEENKTDLVQRNQSFKEKKRTLNWFERQISRKMSHEYYDTIEMEHATAVAASVFAISQELSEIPQEKKTKPPQSSLSRIKSNVDVTKSPISHPTHSSKRFSGSSKPSNDQDNKDHQTERKKPEKTMTPAPSRKITSSSSFGDHKSNISDDKKPETQTPAPKKTPSTIGDKQFMNTDVIKPAEIPKPEPESMPQSQPERGKSNLAGIRPQPVVRPLPPPSPPPPPPPAPMRQVSSRETKADVWERNEMEKIKERYEKLLETIDSWEKRKKMKARRKLNKHEQSDNERKRMKALRKYQEKMKYIDEIAGGARAQADERRRNEVLKAKDKANIIRTTGKLPGPCSCF